MNECMNECAKTGVNNTSLQDNFLRSCLFVFVYIEDNPNVFGYIQETFHMLTNCTGTYYTSLTSKLKITSSIRHDETDLLHYNLKYQSSSFHIIHYLTSEQY